MLVTVNGLVARSYPTGDHDRVLHILTEEYGRVSVMVKGRSTTGKNAVGGIIQPYTYGNYELYRGQSGDLYWLRGGSATRHFFDVTGDIARVSLGAYLCDLAAEMTDEGNTTPESATLLRMLLNTLHVLAKGECSCDKVKAVFEFRAAALMGYQPDLTGCSRCGEPYPASGYFDIMNGRLLCADCQSELNGIRGRITAIEEQERGERRLLCPFTASTLAALRYTLTSPDRKIFSFILHDPAEERAFATLAETYLLNQLERDFETLKFYRSVAEP